MLHGLDRNQLSDFKADSDRNGSVITLAGPKHFHRPRSYESMWAKVGCWLSITAAVRARLG